MAHIPTYCDGCYRSVLRLATDIRQSVATCADCGGEARPIPGSSYGVDDVSLYAELATALREGGMTPWNAQQLLYQATIRPHAAPGQLLTHLSLTMPSLAVLLEIGRRPHARRKADGMLVTLLRGFSSGGLRISAVKKSSGSGSDQA